MQDCLFPEGFLYFFFFFTPHRLTVHCLIHHLSFCFSAISKAKREQEKLVWSQSLRGSDGRRPIQEDREMQQYPQPQMEAAAHCVSQSFARMSALL